MMSITAEHLGGDPDLARRVLVLARIIAPCVDSFAEDNPHREDAIAILRGVAAEAAALPPRSLASTGVGPMRETYRDIGSCFTEDDKAFLRFLCGLTSSPGLPIGSFPEPGFVGRLWPEKYT